MIPAELLCLAFAFGILAGVALALYVVAFVLSRRHRKLQVRRMYEQRAVLYDTIAEKLIIQSQGYSARLFHYIAEKDRRAT